MAKNLREHPNARRISSPAVRAKMLAVIGKQLQASDRDDVMQKAYLRLFTLIDKLPETEDGLLGLTVTIVKGQLVSHFRKKGVEAKRLAPEDEAPADAEPEDELTPEKREEFRRLYEFALERAAETEGDRQCLAWAERLAHGDEYADIARDEDIPEATIRKRMQRFREHMRAHWKEYSALGGVVLVMVLVFFALKPKPEIVAAPGPVLTSPPASTAVAVETPAQQAARLRSEAKALCDRQEWGACWMKLEEAKDLDSLNESRRDVIEMRKAILDSEKTDPKK